MKNMKKFAMFLCAVMLLLGMAGCSGAGKVSVPKGHTPTISENINSLRNSGYRIQRQHYCSVKSIVESGTGHVAELSGESVSPARIMRVTLSCPSHGNTVISDSGSSVSGWKCSYSGAELLHSNLCRPIQWLLGQDLSLWRLKNNGKIKNSLLQFFRNPCYNIKAIVSKAARGGSRY